MDSQEDNQYERRQMKEDDQSEQEYDSEEEVRIAVVKDAEKILNKLSFSNEKHRTALAKSYRQINKLIGTFENDKFNFSEDAEFCEQVVQSAHFFRPYNINDVNFKFMSSVCRDSYRGSRRCQEPLLILDGEVINFQSKKERVVVRQSKQFTLVIQAEPNSTIIYTNHPRAHPLLVTDEQLRKNDKNYYRREAYETANVYETPPCEISVIVIKEFQKMESHMICLKVKTNEVQQQDYYNYHMMGYAQRPKESFNYEDSNSGYISASYFNESPPEFDGSVEAVGSHNGSLSANGYFASSSSPSPNQPPHQSPPPAELELEEEMLEEEPEVESSPSPSPEEIIRGEPIGSHLSLPYQEREESFSKDQENN